jgi:tetratricopeptide (TPR) repeat protein
VDAADEYLAVLRIMASPDATASREVTAAASSGLWELHREFADNAQLESAKKLVAQDAERGFEALSRYVHTHPCAWDAQVELGRLALTRQRFDLAVKLLKEVRWLFPDDPSPHFVYGQALAASGHHEAAIRALDHALRLAPEDADIKSWVAFAQRELAGSSGPESSPAAVAVAHHIARSILVLRGVVWCGRVYPAVLNLHKVPGEVSMAFVLQAAVGHDRRATSASDAEAMLRQLAERAHVSDYAGEILSPETTVGDLGDPGVVLVTLYEPPTKDAAGRFTLEPPPPECRARLLNLIAQDAELSSRLDRHLKSADATLKTRLEL